MGETKEKNKIAKRNFQSNSEDSATTAIRLGITQNSAGNGIDMKKAVVEEVQTISITKITIKEEGRAIAVRKKGTEEDIEAPTLDLDLQLLIITARREVAAVVLGTKKEEDMMTGIKGMAETQETAGM